MSLVSGFGNLKPPIAGALALAAFVVLAGGSWPTQAQDRDQDAVYVPAFTGDKALKLPVAPDWDLRWSLSTSWSLKTMGSRLIPVESIGSKSRTSLHRVLGSG